MVVNDGKMLQGVVEAEKQPSMANIRNSFEKNTISFNTANSTSNLNIKKNRIQSGRMPNTFSRSGIVSHTGITTKECSNYDSTGNLPNTFSNLNNINRNKMLATKESKDHIEINSGAFDTKD